MMVPLFVMRESYFAAMVPTYGNEYVETLTQLLPMWSFYAMSLSAVIGGVFGGLIGKSVLKKHFIKAGMI